jgi:hypothetical protein
MQSHLWITYICAHKCTYVPLGLFLLSVDYCLWVSTSAFLTLDFCMLMHFYIRVSAFAVLPLGFYQCTSSFACEPISTSSFLPVYVVLSLIFYLCEHFYLWFSTCLCISLFLYMCLYFYLWFSTFLCIYISAFLRSVFPSAFLPMGISTFAFTNV